MATIDTLGTKRNCPQCSARFYDLNKRPAVCPKCAHSFDPTVQPRARRARRTASEAADSEDLLLQHMAKSAPGKSKAKPKKEEGEVDLEDFGEIEPAGGEGDMEELEVIDDMEVLEEIEAPGKDGEDELTLDENGKLIDDVSEAEDAEEEEETPKAARKKPGKR